MIKARKNRKGFSLVEMVVAVLVLSIIVIACVKVTQATSALRIQSRNSIVMSTHNLNVMERLKEEIDNLGETGYLYTYYGFADDEEEADMLEAAGKDPNDRSLYRMDFSSEQVRTEVYIDIYMWDNFFIYDVRIESKMIGYPQRLVNTLILTSIGVDRLTLVTPDNPI